MPFSSSHPGVRPRDRFFIRGQMLLKPIISALLASGVRMTIAIRTRISSRTRDLSEPFHQKISSVGRSIEDRSLQAEPFGPDFSGFC
jgi:hypothetical protein